MWLGIVGSEEIKFSPLGKDRALRLLTTLIIDPKVIGVVSGGCHLGGIDIWAEEIAKINSKSTKIFLPKKQEWTSYRSRNIQIAKYSDKVICITVDRYPPGYTGMQFSTCYHCNTADHIKSGGCWTMKAADRFGKDSELIVVQNI